MWRPGLCGDRAAGALPLALPLPLALALALALAREHGGVTPVAPEGRETSPVVGLGRRAISPRAYVHLTRRPMGWPTPAKAREGRGGRLTGILWGSHANYIFALAENYSGFYSSGHKNDLPLWPTLLSTLERN